MDPIDIEINELRRFLEQNGSADTLETRRATNRIRILQYRKAYFAEANPLLELLRAQGFNVSELTFLDRNEQPYTKQQAMHLLEHLNSNYSVEIKRKLARGLINIVADDQLSAAIVSHFRNTSDESLKTEFGQALSESCTLANLDDMVEFIKDTRHGEARFFLPDGLVRLMGKKAGNVLLTLIDDRDFNTQIIEALGKIRYVDAASSIEKYTTHKDGYVRAAAKKALKRCSRVAPSYPNLPPPAKLDDLGTETVYETSIEFDIEHVKPFLQHINRALKFKLPSRDIAEYAIELDTGTEQGFIFTTTYRGNTTKVFLCISKEDIDIASLLFYAPIEALIRELLQQMEISAEKKGI